MSKSFFFSSNPISKRVDHQEAAAEALPAMIGVSDAERRHARAMLDAVGAGVKLRESHEPHLIKHRGEEYTIDHQYTNEQGEARAVAYRPTGGGRFEKVHLREERVGERSFMLVEGRMT